MQFIPNNEGGGLKIVFPGETHTLGNFLNTKITNHKKTLFSGYNVPHPLEKTMSIEFLTEGNEEEILLECLEDLEKKLVSMRDSFDKIRKRD